MDDTTQLEDGDKVVATIYGIARTGRVQQTWKGIGTRPSIVWVMMDDTKRLMWFHLVSLTKVEE